MAPQKLTEYERRRLENIKRNDEMLAALKIHSKVSILSAAVKTQRAQIKSYKVSPEKKKQKTESPIVLRRSLRTRGVPPDSSTAAGLKDDFDENSRSLSKKSPRVPLGASLKMKAFEKGPISMENAYRTDGSDANLIELILSCSRKSKLSFSNDSVGDSNNRAEGNEDFWSLEGERKVRSSVDIETLKLEPQYVARIVPGRIFTVKFFPAKDMRIVVAGNKEGDIGFWNIDAKGKDGNGIHLYHPHSAPVSGILFDSFSLSKMFSCSYDGFVRLLDIERGMFDLVYSSDYGVFSLSQKPDDLNSLYFGGPDGKITSWDARSGKSIFSRNLHENRINTIDFNLQNTTIMATSSTDATVCIWDLRSIGAERPTSLTTVSHKRAVQSAYFSPSGDSLATTSVDDKIGLISGENYKDVSMVYHNNQTGRWISSFRGIWGWDDSYIFVGNLKRGVDVISTAGKKVVATLKSEYMTAIPCRFDSHPYEVGMLAGATAGGQVYTWKQSLA